MDEQYDVVVVGGGAAGLSGALILARALRSVLVIDDGAPRNAPAAGVHNYLGRDGVAPAVLAATGRAEVAGYGGTIVDGQVAGARRMLDGRFEVTLVGGARVAARRLLVASGLVDELPEVEGLAGRWGRDVLHCPYCHGWEVRDRSIAVLSTGPMAMHQVQLLRQWSPNVTLLRHTAPELDDEQRNRLAALDVTVVDGEVAAVEVQGDRLTGLRLRSGRVVACDAVVVAPRFTARADVLTSLGLEPVEQEIAGHVVGSAVPAGPTGATAVPGVWVAGNVADLYAGVINAAAAGFTAAVAINADLVEEDVRRAVDVHTTEAGMFWEGHYGAREQVWSGRPNAALVDVAESLPPGKALDLGTGEGADAVWLAERGWDVTGVDVSETALRRVAKAAAAAGVADRVELQRHDLAESFPVGEFDLVSALFLQSPVAFPRDRVLRAAAGAVAPGGLLVVVAHAEMPPWGRRHGPPVRMPTPESELAGLGLVAGGWRVERQGRFGREAVGPGGERAVLVDSVVVVRRRG